MIIKILFFQWIWLIYGSTRSSGGELSHRLEYTQLLEQGEGSQVEFKPSFDKEAIESVWWHVQTLGEVIKSYRTMTFDYRESGDGFLVTVSYEKQKVSNEGVNEGVSNKYQALHKHIQKKPGMKAHQLSELLNVGVSTMGTYIKELKRAEKIEFRGAPKTGGYYISELQVRIKFF